MRSHVVLPSPIGPVTVVAEDGAVTHVHLGDGAPGSARADGAIEPGRIDEEPFAAAARQLAAYFAGELRDFDLPLAPRGDEFHQRVWSLLQQIPYGETRSYGQLARALGDIHLAQAVGAANGRNPIAIVIPCHRVIGSDGTLVGYAGGLDRKRFLLALEEPPAQEVGRLF